MRLITGDVSFLLPLGWNRDYQSVVELVHFVNKYECAVAISQLGLFVKIPSATEGHGFVRLLLAMYLDLKHDIANMIQDESKIFEWLRPSDDPDSTTVTPPFDLFQLLPPRCLWALMAANVSNRQAAAVSVASDGELLCPKERFLVLLSHAQTGKPEQCSVLLQ